MAMYTHGTDLHMFTHTPWPCTRMVQIYTCLHTHYVYTLNVTPYRVLHSYRAGYLTNELSSTWRTRLTTTSVSLYMYCCVMLCCLFGSAASLVLFLPCLCVVYVSRLHYSSPRASPSLLLSSVSPLVMATARLSSSACPVVVGRFVWQSVNARRPTPGIHAGLDSAPFVHRHNNKSLPCIRVSGLPVSFWRFWRPFPSPPSPEHSRTTGIPPLAPCLSVYIYTYIYIYILADQGRLRPKIKYEVCSYVYDSMRTHTVLFLKGISVRFFR